MNDAHSGSVRLLVCDDHLILAEALKMVVDSHDGIELIADPTGDPEEAIQLAGSGRPHVVLMDVDLGADIDGIEATRRIKDISPETKVVILTGSKDNGLLVRAVEAGASGFLGKGKAIDAVLEAVEAAARGEVLIDPTELSKVLHEVARERANSRDAELLLRQLTAREREILQQLAHGKTNEEVAGELFISPQTVQTHVRNTFAKLGVHSKLEAVTFAVRHRVIEI